MLVAELLAEAGVTSVIDLGCNNCKLLRLLKGLLPSVTYLAGLDIDKEILEECGKMLRPLPGDWLVRRQLPLTIDLVHGSCGQVELALAFLETASISQVDAVTSVELIEHLDPDTLATLPATVLGALQPKVWLVTTPNSDFNELFPNFIGPFRHWDHRFEWSRAEFKEWAEQVLADFPDYTVAFDGAGYWEAKRESHGPASQVAVFTRKKNILSEKEVDLLHLEAQQNGNTRRRDNPAQEWMVVEKIEYPVAQEEKRSKEEQLGDELIFHLRGFTWDVVFQGEESDEELAIALSSLMQFDSVANLSEDIGEVKRVLQARGFKVVDGHVLVQVEQSKSPWKSIWWPESDESDEEDERAVQEKTAADEEGEDQEFEKNDYQE